MKLLMHSLNDFLAAVANSNELQNRDFEVMDHFIDTLRNLFLSATNFRGSLS